MDEKIEGKSEIKSENKALAPIKQQSQSLSSMGVFTSIEKFEEAIRMSKALAASTLVPKEYQGNISNCMIAIDTAQRLKISPFATMQNLYIVNGRPSWSSQFIIAAINTSGRFAEPLKFEITGTGENLKCYAYTKDFSGKELRGPEINIQMAKEEGWSTKNGSKWRTMPQVMIQYRAASFFGRLHCPDILMGVYTDDENIEREAPTIIDITVQDVEKEIKEKANAKEIDIQEEKQPEKTPENELVKQNENKTDEPKAEQTTMAGPEF